MTPDQFRSVVDEALRDPTNFPWLAFVLAGLAFTLASGVAAYFGAYLGEKGKNTATREDIETITKKVESVRHTYSERIEAVKGLIQLRGAALAERLKAHQEAYALWLKLHRHVHHSHELNAVVMECQTWWAEHCLYLAPEAREAFQDAIFAASVHQDFLGPGCDRKLAKDNWAELTKAGAAIVRGVELPDIGEAQFADRLAKTTSSDTEGPKKVG
jgi:hypothetical protein